MNPLDVLNGARRRQPQSRPLALVRALRLQPPAAGPSSGGGG